MTNMTNELKVDIKQTGFPVKFGEIQLWFDSSLENLRRFFKVDEEVQKRLREARKKTEDIHFPEGIENYEVDDFTDEDIAKIYKAFDVNKDFIAAQYDIIFGDGTFEKIYEKYPDIAALEEALPSLSEAIAKKVEEQEQERTGSIDYIKREALEKKSEKASKSPSDN